jgi:peroxiredoxin (alkyl hydroperoxide reductase subunit C)
MEPTHFARVGQPAPQFDMLSTRNLETLQEHVRLEDYRGQWLILFFYPADFTFVCPTEIRGFRDHYEQFRSLKADVLAVSTDSVYSHRAWIQTPPDQGGVGHIPFPLASDIHKSVSRHYQVLDEDAGMALRGLFIIDPEGVLRYQVVHDMDIGRSVNETLRVLQALQTGGLCPVEWQPGQSLLAST